jgi:O-antigen/teichoic acid export membrane protein
VEYRILKNVARFCTYQSIWTVGMLCVTGLDVTIVGHYDYIQTAYYSIATLPTNFVLLIVSSILNPLMPASSALSTQRSPAEMGDILARITRYGTMILLLTGLPLIVCGFPILRLWVGEPYALHTVQYLRILVLANVIRSLCQPYATMVSATGRQRAATAAAVCEAVVNLGSSIYLASRYGAIGVALGTLLGSFVSIALHFAITMHYTHSTLAISRSRLLVKGLVRPAVIALPSLALIPLWWSSSVAIGLPLATVWGLSTLLIAWFGSLDREERLRLTDLGVNFFSLRSKLNTGKAL